MESGLREKGGTGRWREANGVDILKSRINRTCCRMKDLLLGGGEREESMRIAEFLSCVAGKLVCHTP